MQKRRFIWSFFILMGLFAGPVMTVASGPRIPVPAHKPDIEPVSASALAAARQGDHDLYPKIFDAQELGHWTKADQLIDQLNSRLLMGHVQYQRYMHPRYVSRFSELKQWIYTYPGHPGAREIYALALRKDPVAGRALPKPAGFRAPDGVMRDLRPYMMNDRKASGLPRATERALNRHLNKGQASAALTLLRTTEKQGRVAPLNAAIIKSRIAATYLHLGHQDKAQDLAFEALTQSKGRAPIAGWVSGLSAWVARDYAGAAAFFERTAQGEQASAWTRSAGAYWAARSHMRIGNHDEVVQWLEEAARYPRSFYGLIATRALNRKLDFNWRLKRPASDIRSRLMALPAMQRASVLIDMGRHDLAEQELLSIGYIHDGALRHALGAYAIENNLPEFAMRHAMLYRDQSGDFFDLGLYPVHGQTLSFDATDKALINAFIRQESKFRAGANNPSGAVGLMQIMPRTASYITGNDRLAGVDKKQLQDPAINVDIGTRYIRHLMGSDVVQGDLFSLAIAYNAGPGNLARWKRLMSDIDDPLLFIEMIPMSETRAFVERVMANYWIYSDRLGQPIPTLEAVASGTWPVYASMGGQAVY